MRRVLNRHRTSPIRPARMGQPIRASSGRIKLVAFLQLYNELSAGNLIRCLENCKLWADEIFIYDDCSDDGSYEAYLNYTDKDHIIRGSHREFNKELFHKAELLNLALASKPDWIGWIDGDAILCKWVVENCRAFLPEYASRGIGLLELHNLNLWRHPAFYRVDNSFDGLWHKVFWHNNGRLHYSPEVGLHKQQFPLGTGKMASLAYDQPLIHYGFASEIGIARKYLTYKSYGQSGWALDRLIDEQSSFELKKVPRYIYPDINVPDDYDTVQMLTPITFDEYRPFNSWEEYLEKHK